VQCESRAAAHKDGREAHLIVAREYEQLASAEIAPPLELTESALGLVIYIVPEAGVEHEGSN
jgi:hypothetical protein